MSECSENMDFECTFNFEFNKTSKVKPIVKLPVKLSDHPSLANIEIRGLHLSKKDGDFSIETILDLADGHLQQSMEFHSINHFNQNLINDIVKKGLEINRSFVFLEE